MLGQIGACLALGGSEENKRGGFWTPATLLGDQLPGLLEDHAGLSFKLLDSTPTAI